MSPTRSRPQRVAIRPNVLLDRLGLWMSHSRRIDGLWVGCWTSDGEKRLMAFGRVGEALSLIKQYDPLRYDRLRRDLDRIWVFLLPGNWGEYRHALKMCVLDERFVLSETTRPEQIASTIVHEATHARLMCGGIGYEAASRARVEAVCFRRQRAFAARLPAGEPAREEAERSLTGYPSKFWTDEAFRERNDQGAAEAFRYLGMSEFFIRTAFCLRAPLRRIHNLVRRL
jgi:hypothetical protein